MERVADASVGLILVDARGWTLLQLRDARAVYPHHWGTVGGAVEPGETIDEALAREVREETGYTISHRVWLASRGTIVLPDGRTRTATFFAGDYDPWQDLECREGTAITFVDPATLDALPVYPGQRPLLTEALARFRALRTFEAGAGTRAEFSLRDLHEALDARRRELGQARERLGDRPGAIEAYETAAARDGKGLLAAELKLAALGARDGRRGPAAGGRRGVRRSG